MKINRVKLFNYRCFKELELELNDSFTILVGNNGSGKSTILDGISLGLASYFVGMKGDSPKGIDKRMFDLKPMKSAAAWNANLSILLELIVVANFVVKRLNGHVQRIPKAAQRPMAMPLS